MRRIPFKLIPSVRPRARLRLVASDTAARPGLPLCRLLRVRCVFAFVGFLLLRAGFFIPHNNASSCNRNSRHLSLSIRFVQPCLKMRGSVRCGSFGTTTFLKEPDVDAVRGCVLARNWIQPALDESSVGRWHRAWCD